MPSQDQAGNFPTVTRMLLSKIDITQPGRVSYVYDQYMFHYLVRFLSIIGSTLICLIRVLDRRVA
jgi:hypothetical protein